MQVLAEAKQQLQVIFRGKLEAAAKAGDHPAVVRFAQLYVPLGLQVSQICCLCSVPY